MYLVISSTGYVQELVQLIFSTALSMSSTSIFMLVLNEPERKLRDDGRNVVKLQTISLHEHGSHKPSISFIQQKALNIAK